MQAIGLLCRVVWDYPTQRERVSELLRAGPLGLWKLPSPPGAPTPEFAIARPSTHDEKHRMKLEIQAMLQRAAALEEAKAPIEQKQKLMKELEEMVCGFH